MARLLKHLLVCAAAVSLAVAAGSGTVEINDLNVTNIGTTTFTVVWTTTEVSTPGLEVFSDGAGLNSVSATLGLDYYPVAEGDPGVVNDAAGRISRRDLEVLAINRRVVAVRVTGLAPGTTYFLRPRTFGAGGVDNGTGVLPLRQVTTALFSSMVVDGRLLRVRFSAVGTEGMIALVQGPAGSTPLSAILGDSTATDAAVLPLAGLLDTASGTQALYSAPQQITIRLLGAGAPSGTFTQTIAYGTAYQVAKLDAVDVGTATPSPVFTTHPVNLSGQVGATVTFGAAATGTPSPTYKWQRQPVGGAGWGDLSESAIYVGVTTTALQVRSLTLAMSGDQFRCIAANGALPDATSNGATLSVTTGPTGPVIATQPASVGVNSGGNATFAVVATGEPAPTYQWKKGGADIPNATTASLALNSVTSGDADSYTVVVTNPISNVTSNAAVLTVYVVPAITTQPVAQLVVAGQSATFAVVATGTPEPKYQWKKDGANLAGATTATLTLNSLTVADSGTLTVEVTNAAAGGLGGTVTSAGALLTVNPVAPVFISTPGSAATAIQGLSFLYGPVLINATPAIFTATGLPPGLGVNAASGNISGVPLVIGTLPASFTVVLKAENAAGSDTRTLTLTVNPTPPQITSAAAASGQVGTAFAYAIAAENSPTSFGATGLPPLLTVNPGTGAISGNPTQAGTFSATISATNAGGTSSQSLTLTISPAPSAPVFSGNASPGGTQGVLFSFTPTFSGTPTGYAISAGTLPGGLTLNPSTGAITGTPTAVGEFTFTLQATNAGGATGAEIRLTINPAPAAPVITSANDAATTVGAVFSFTLTATGEPAVYTFIANDCPAWLSLNASTGVLSGTPVLGTFTLRVSATNSPSGGGTLQGPESILIITVGPSPSAPVINSAAIVPGRVGQPVNYLLTTTPAATSFAVTSSKPAWLSLDSGTGVVSGTPDAAGPVRVVFAASSATFGQGLGLEVLFDIAPALLAPVITSSGTAQGQVGQPFRYAIAATNGPITAYAMPAGTLPTGLSLNTSAGLIEGIPLAATSAPVTVSLTASNAAGASEVKTLEILILAPPSAPVITSPLEANGRVGAAFAYQIAASESPSSFVATDLPAGLGLDPASGLISGTPTTAGSYAVILRAANGRGLGAAATLQLTLVGALGAPRITSFPAAVGQVGTNFNYAIVAEPGPILNYNLAGSLPLGLSLNTTTGVISGRPSRAGLYLVRLTATNSTGTSLPQPLVIWVKPGTGVPVITSPRYDSATVGEAYFHFITATNMPGSRPFAPPNSLDAVNLPPGLAVNPAMGAIEGTPTSVGSYLVSLVGTNASGVGAIRDLIIVVRPSAAAPEITSVLSAAGRAGAAFSYTITATHSPTAFEVLDAPAWMTVNSQSGVIAGTPSAPGTFTVRLLARNSAGRGEAATLTITLSPAVGTPVITSSRSADGRIGSAFSHRITTAPVATSFVATGLPAGLAINGTTGVISGTPTASGRFAVTLTVANGSGQSAPTLLMIDIESSRRMSPGS